MSTTLKNIIWVLKLNFTKLPLLSLLRIIGNINSYSSTLFSSFTIGLIVTWLSEYVSKNQDNSLILYALIAFGTYYFANGILNVLSNYGDNLAIIQLAQFIPEVLLHQKLNTLSTSTLENPEVQNKINRYRRNSNMLDQMTRTLLSLTAVSVTLLIALSALIYYVPIATILLVLASLPNIWSNKYIADKMWNLEKDSTVDNRRAYNMIYMITEPQTLKEVRLLGAYDYLRKYFDGFAERYFHKIKTIYIQWSAFDAFNYLLKGTLLIFGFFQVADATLQGQLPVSQIFFFITALISISSNIDNFAWYLSNILSSNTRVGEMRELLEYREDNPLVLNHFPLLKTPPSIKLNNVSFHYPGSSKVVIADLDLEIKPGEKIAIVGENGAGKTTLVKLLSNTYPVSTGEILVNGENLNSFDPYSWYQNLGVLYQDYNTYADLTVSENIALGRIEDNLNLEQIRDAATKADALAFINDYKYKFDQILSEQYEEGIRPSTGQWQKLAIARFFYRNAPILILDEPTASIDAVAEANIFDRIYSFIEDKTVIIISHRFSTVRKADRIIVMEKGKILESGSHEELLSLNGKYAHAFKLQAKGYQE